MTVTNTNTDSFSSLEQITNGTKTTDIKIRNGKIEIEITDAKKVNINGKPCIPCSELEKISNKQDELLKVFNKYCK